MAQKDFEQETALEEGPLGRAGIVARKQPTLSWVDGQGSHSVSVETRCRIGSAEGADVRVEDRTVSRLHAEVELANDGLWVRDLGSKNGTFVNDILVERARVPDGASLRVGGISMAVRYSKAPTLVELWPDDHFGPLLGRSPAMRELFHKISKLGPLQDSVLIEGETGTGKELIARALHGASPRKDGPFVVVDCGAMPDDLLEAELFGHTKGAFTGAQGDRIGNVEAADGGTLFLDEIGELPLAMQPKLLRLLETKTFRPLGTNEHRSSNVRFLAATHRNLGEMVNRGSFREDLFFRLTVFSITAPPLRARSEDLPLLISHFLPEHRREAELPRIVAEAMGSAWPGNVRELKNFVSRALVLGTATKGWAAGTSTISPSADSGDITALPLGLARERVVAAFEQSYVRKLLEAHHHNVTAAAEAAGIDRSYLHRLIRKYEQ